MVSSAVMRTADLDFTLPEPLIAQHPCESRDGSRLLVLDRARGTFKEDEFRNIPAYFEKPDCLVTNDTRVIRARLRGRKPTGAAVEIFLLRELRPGSWEALVRPSRRLKPGAPVMINDQVTATVGDVLADGRREVSFTAPDVLQVLEASGDVPLPPYIHREEADASDLTRYQTIYARVPGAVAAPTAGLHYTDAVLKALADRGVRRAELTLHVGYGTFKPVLAEQLKDHRVDAEYFHLPGETAGTLNRTRAEGGRVVAVGTTSTRVLETQYADGSFRGGDGFTERYIFPPYDFQGVDVLQTNFHLPRSSLLALVCAFAGAEFVLEAYRHAVEKEFRFYSYGDTMLIL